MLQAIKAILHRRRDARAVAALSERDLADLGMSRDQVMHFLTLPADAPDRVLAMARIFGLTEGEVKRDHGAWLDMVETCGTCPDRAACALLLSRGAFANPRDATFCPNHAGFRTHWKAA